MSHFQISGPRRKEEVEGLSDRDPALKQWLTNSFAMITAARLWKTLIFRRLEHWETATFQSSNRDNGHRSGGRDPSGEGFWAVLAFDQPRVAPPFQT